jgi:hypothetical protein
MKRVYLVIREFSYTNDEKNFSKGEWLPEVFTTFNNAKAFIEKYTKDGETPKEEKDCFEFAFRKTVHTTSDTFIRWTIIGRNMNAIY